MTIKQLPVSQEREHEALHAGSYSDRVDVFGGRHWPERTTRPRRELDVTALRWARWCYIAALVLSVLFGLGWLG